MGTQNLNGYLLLERGFVIVFCFQLFRWRPWQVQTADPRIRKLAESLPMASRHRIAFTWVTASQQPFSHGPRSVIVAELPHVMLGGASALYQAFTSDRGDLRIRRKERRGACESLCPSRFWSAHDTHGHLDKRRHTKCPKFDPRKLLPSSPVVFVIFCVRRWSKSHNIDSAPIERN